MKSEEIEIDGRTIEVLRGDRADVLIFEDGSREIVDNFEQWIMDNDLQRHKADGGSETWDGVCPMCGDPYENYLDHLSRCTASE